MHIYETRRNSNDRCEQGILVGYDRGSPAYLVYLPESRTVKRVRCVSFSSKFENPVYDVIMKFLFMENPVESTAQDTHPWATETIEGNPVKPTGNINVEQAVEPQVVVQPTSDDEQVRYPKRDNRGVKPRRLDDYNMSGSGTGDDLSYEAYETHCYKFADTPETYSEALSSANFPNWREAMEREMAALKQNNTFEVMPLPER